MSLPEAYPPDTYHASDGQVSAWTHTHAETPDITFGNGTTCEYVALGAQTAGRFGLYRWTFGDDESGPDPHFHRSISEQFYVLSGQVRLYDGAKWITATSGDFLYVPEGGIHAFRGSERATMLLMFAPGAPREDYFETLARGEAMSEEQRDAFMLRHDTYWL